MLILRSTYPAALVALALTSTLPTLAQADVDHIVLVHGMGMDGSSWRPVYDQLTENGQDVWVAQLPQTSAEADIAALRRLMDNLDGDILLVGHSYGGMVITEVGIASQVVGLVYVAAFQPDAGETMAELSATVPSALPQDGVLITGDGYITLKPEVIADVVAFDLSAEEAHYIAHAQKAASGAIMGRVISDVAWTAKPAWSIIATQDGVIAPAQQEEMSARSGATVTRIEGGHLLPLAHPDAVADVIEEAVRSLQ